jgi:hypothetical protein
VVGVEVREEGGEGSTYICRRAFWVGVGRWVVVEEEEGMEGIVNISSSFIVVEEGERRVGARILRFVVVEVVEVVGREEEVEEAEDIIRFWNSRCLFLSLSSG